MPPLENKWLALSRPLPPPTIDPHLETLGPFSRSTECLRFFILSVEHWLSPAGRLRWWIKLNLCLSAWVLVPAVFLMPVVSIVLHELDGWLSMLLSIVLKVILLTILIAGALLARKYFPSLSPGSSRRR